MNYYREKLAEANGRPLHKWDALLFGVVPAFAGMMVGSKEVQLCKSLSLLLIEVWGRAMVLRKISIEIKYK
ncbi:MAG: hypothetical protein K9K75_03235 [Deltaproteobacteria bacterium]|nr:hypothetical protein [Deltaproteobacteria bacterium]